MSCDVNTCSVCLNSQTVLFVVLCVVSSTQSWLQWDWWWWSSSSGWGVEQVCESSTSGVSITMYICYIMCACMYAEIMWGCSYTCMYIRCVYIRTNANLVSVRTRLIGASLSEPHTSNTTDFQWYVSIYVCIYAYVTAPQNPQCLYRHVYVRCVNMYVPSYV